MKLHPKDTANGGHASMSSSSTQQFHFPSALPPPNSRTLSGSLDFPYDNSYFTDDRSLRASQVRMHTTCVAMYPHMHLFHSRLN